MPASRSGSKRPPFAALRRPSRTGTPLSRQNHPATRRRPAAKSPGTSAAAALRPRSRSRQPTRRTAGCRQRHRTIRTTARQPGPRARPSWAGSRDRAARHRRNLSRAITGTPRERDRRIAPAGEWSDRRSGRIRRPEFSTPRIRTARSRRRRFGPHVLPRRRRGSASRSVRHVSGRQASRLRPRSRLTTRIRPAHPPPAHRWSGAGPLECIAGRRRVSPTGYSRRRKTPTALDHSRTSDGGTPRIFVQFAGLPGCSAGAGKPDPADGPERTRRRRCGLAQPSAVTAG